jgi:hypothetical protein
MLLLIGIVALLWATAMANLLCWRANIPWRSKFGYTFLWRLNFLGDMPAAPRKQLLLTTAKSPEARVVATSVDAWFETGNDWDAANLAPVVIRAVVAANPNASESDIDRALNQFARFSLFPPSQALRHAAVSDFWAASRRSSADITQNLFLTTAYAYDHLVWMKQAATLEQFTVPRADLAQLSRTTYFRIWEWLSYRGCCFAAAIIALLIFLMNRGSSGIFASQLSVAAIGAFILFVTCFFVQLQDRFIVTAMQTIWLAIIAGVVTLVARHDRSENI